MLHLTQVVLLPTGSAVFSLLTHHWSSFPSPYTFLDKAGKTTANFFTCLLTPFLTCSTTQDAMTSFLQPYQLSGSIANKLESHQSPKHSAGVGPTPTNKQKKRHIFIVSVIACSLKQTQTNPTIEGHGHTCYRNWWGVEFLTFRCLCCPSCRGHMPGMVRVPKHCLALGLFAGALSARDQ